MSKALVRAPERGARIDGFVRKRWAFWLRSVLPDYHIELDSLAEALATVPGDKQTWQRSRVRRWLNFEITVSADGAFSSGAALARLKVPVSGPEALFAAGHMPAFIDFVRYLVAAGSVDQVAAAIAILPFSAYAFGTLDDPTAATVTGQNYTRMHRVSVKAFGELRSRSWPHSTFDQAWKQYAQRKPREQRKSDWAMESAYNLAASSSIDPQNAIAFAFPLIAEWVSGLDIGRKELERLFGFADAFEEFCMHDRRNLRVLSLAFRNEEVSAT